MYVMKTLPEALCAFAQVGWVYRNTFKITQCSAIRKCSRQPLSEIVLWSLLHFSLWTFCREMHLS